MLRYGDRIDRALLGDLFDVAISTPVLNNMRQVIVTHFEYIGAIRGTEPAPRTERCINGYLCHYLPLYVSAASR